MDKTWEFPITNLNLSTVSDELANLDAVLQAKLGMVDGGLTSPWTVIGSSDGVNASMDGTDRWVDIADIVADTPGNPHSWIVLEQPGIQLAGWVNPLQILWTANGATVGADYLGRSIVVSLGDGFGAANGGTDGDESNEPTATDQWAPFYQQAHLASAGGMTAMSINVLMSDDGAVTRIVYGDHSGGPFCRGWIGLEMLQRPAPEIQVPFVVAMFGGDANTTLIEEWGLEEANNALGIRFRQPDLGVAGRNDPAGYATHARVVGMESYSGIGGDNPLVTSLPAVHDITGEFLLTKIGVFARQAFHSGYQGYLGNFYDLYAIGANAAAEDMLPAAGNKTWANTGGIIIPWLDDSVTNLAF